MSRYLAIKDGVEPYIEESEAAVAYAIANSVEIDYYLIEVHPDTRVPTLSEKVVLSSAPRTVVKRREAVSLQAGSRDIGQTEIEVDAT